MAAGSRKSAFMPVNRPHRFRRLKGMKEILYGLHTRGAQDNSAEDNGADEISNQLKQIRRHKGTSEIKRLYCLPTAGL